MNHTSLFPFTAEFKGKKGNYKKLKSRKMEKTRKIIIIISFLFITYSKN